MDGFVEMFCGFFRIFSLDFESADDSNLKREDF